MRTLPPLTALRAFEATARLGSVTKAAEELSVTHAAVSHQLRTLEEWIGRPLFRREHRRIIPNEAGIGLLPVVTDAFDRIAARASELRAQTDRRILTISSAPSVAHRWIVPRLAAFSARHPEIDVRLEHSTRLIDLAREGVDVAIRYGSGPWPGLTAHRLMPGYAKPLASPVLLERHGLATTQLPLPASIIASLPLQHEESRDLWRQWFADAGLIGADVSSGAVFHEAGVLIDVAMAAQGVVLGRVALAEGLIAQGVLRILSDRPIGASASYWLCYPEARRDDPVVAAFRAFVFEEVGLEPASHDSG
ncbi:glycine cleavage system transcriptional activator [alpha proteobacterium BAL199]|jgi:LysR family transcriptional regulator, glycine cleavage system transcriptional activator|nr:glycine cleavage system transcriptional activator [alpha proteobacterium BAL199]